MQVCLVLNLRDQREVQFGVISGSVVDKSNGMDNLHVSSCLGEDLACVQDFDSLCRKELPRHGVPSMQPAIFYPPRYRSLNHNDCNDCVLNRNIQR